MADNDATHLAKMSAGSAKRGTRVLIHSHELSLGAMLNLRNDDYPSLDGLDSYGHSSRLKEGTVKSYNKYFSLPDGYKFVIAESGERTCHWVSDSLFVYDDALSSGFRFQIHDFIPVLLADIGISPCQLAPNAWRLLNYFIVLCLRKNITMTSPLFRKIFQFKNSPSSSPGWVYINHRANHPHIFNTASIPENNTHWKFDFLKILWEMGDWGTLFRKQFSRVSDGSSKSIVLSEVEKVAYDELIKDGGESLSWDLVAQ